MHFFSPLLRWWTGIGKCNYYCISGHQYFPNLSYLISVQRFSRYMLTSWHPESFARELAGREICGHRSTVYWTPFLPIPWGGGIIHCLRIHWVGISGTLGGQPTITATLAKMGCHWSILWGRSLGPNRTNFHRLGVFNLTFSQLSNRQSMQQWTFSDPLMFWIFCKTLLVG